MTRFRFAAGISFASGAALWGLLLLPGVNLDSADGRVVLILLMLCGFFPTLICRTHFLLQSLLFFGGLALSVTLVAAIGNYAALPGTLLALAVTSPTLVVPLLMGSIAGYFVAAALERAKNVVAA
jgi:hypothetical protein